MFWVLMAGLIVSTAAGLIYPALAIVWYKLRFRSRITVREILEVIGW